MLTWHVLPLRSSTFTTRKFLLMSASPHVKSPDVRRADGFGGTFYGVYPAIVTDLDDPDGQGRIRVKLPWSPDPEDEDYEAWARLATMMAGPDRGTWFRPDVEDEVLVAFESGNPRRPYVVGGLWNGADTPNDDVASDTENNLKEIRSRTGVTITIDDGSEGPSVTLETPGGRVVALNDAEQSIRLDDGAGNSIQLGASGITIESAGPLNITAARVSVDAPSVNVSAAISSFTGIISTDSMLKATTVVASTYTPGAGNIW